jgi:viroplasmin and RNaseH domain-containing protein
MSLDGEGFNEDPFNKLVIDTEADLNAGWSDFSKSFEFAQRKAEFLETRETEDDFQAIVNSVDDYTFKNWCQEILERQDTYMPDQASLYLKLGALLKQFDSERFKKFFETKPKASTYINLKNQIEAKINNGKKIDFEDCLRELNSIRVLYPEAFEEDIKPNIPEAFWDAVVEKLKLLNRKSYALKLVELYILGMQIDAEKLVIKMPFSQGLWEMVHSVYESHTNRGPVYMRAAEAANLDVIKEGDELIGIRQNDYTQFVNDSVRSLKQYVPEQSPEKKVYDLIEQLNKVVAAKYVRILPDTMS